MDYNAITQFITTVGFPICACAFMWRYLTNNSKELTKAVDNNTDALKELISMIKGGISK